MKKTENIAWTFYMADEISFDESKVGKWMYFFSINDDLNRIDKLCSDAVELGIVQESKHTHFDFIGLNPMAKDKNTGVCCFYLNYDDIEGHKKIITYFIKNNMIPKTKTGKFYNNSFKLDDQTRAGQYGTDFNGTIKLEQFIDLYTGKWKYNLN